MTSERRPEGSASDEPGSPGVVGEQPNRVEDGPTAPVDEAPDGATPSDVTDSSDDSLPPKLL
jgi:hypothetical protein